MADAFRFSRRALLALLAGAALDPERLLWIPNRRHISIPRPVVRPADHISDRVFLREIWTQMQGAWLVKTLTARGELLSSRVWKYAEPPFVVPSWAHPEPLVHIELSAASRA